MFKGHSALMLPTHTMVATPTTHRPSFACVCAHNHCPMCSNEGGGCAAGWETISLHEDGEGLDDMRVETTTNVNIAADASTPLTCEPNTAHTTSTVASTTTAIASAPASAPAPALAPATVTATATAWCSSSTFLNCHYAGLLCCPEPVRRAWTVVDFVSSILINVPSTQFVLQFGMLIVDVDWVSSLSDGGGILCDQAGHSVGESDTLDSSETHGSSGVSSTTIWRALHQLAPLVLRAQHVFFVTGRGTWHMQRVMRAARAHFGQHGARAVYTVIANAGCTEAAKVSLLTLQLATAGIPAGLPGVCVATTASTAEAYAEVLNPCVRTFHVVDIGGDKAGRGRRGGHAYGGATTGTRVLLPCVDGCAIGNVGSGGPIHTPARPATTRVTTPACWAGTPTLAQNMVFVRVLAHHIESGTSVALAAGHVPACVAVGTALALCGLPSSHVAKDRLPWTVNRPDGVALEAAVGNEAACTDLHVCVQTEAACTERALTSREGMHVFGKCGECGEYVHVALGYSTLVVERDVCVTDTPCPECGCRTAFRHWGGGILVCFDACWWRAEMQCAVHRLSEPAHVTTGQGSTMFATASVQLPATRRVRTGKGHVQFVPHIEIVGGGAGGSEATRGKSRDDGSASDTEGDDVDDDDHNPSTHSTPDLCAQRCGVADMLSCPGTFSRTVFAACRTFPPNKCVERAATLLQILVTVQ